ncbi:similar to Saccharomyces cerevisiae YOL151W GRE2 3-methylbutanal reductase and NADPH-dependent methylglyoxal reductase (D-lactaldehyde dehydrogenase) [Maudiozyma saulgeensis]|uniref:Similar to Saccharomyces cerevisiae YOL151W GRE2 3-methylbutanal reductase and NADPH-dependent methylglyoxal reductase (D-lactaldehyde dehydrogenase) n=1 Tax=Maudiozyma saulgeensis TaxID=1789683 RepID=A0A1X7RB11_9SACH|nr:similar to Saccharomyces cerevisiae YOL151W GRE2 3-methylbutanal reductase and NADPH-dependent methylglyoxal reductase (D-lactaldehyde dehydrogenase) [Kazachstania saulgeensis]
MSVFVTGATGYIAQHIVQELLKQNYKVIGSARSQVKCDNLIKNFGYNKNFSMVVVPDISELSAFDEVFQKYGDELKIVLHTASPFHFDVKDVKKELLIPACNGTLGILESIKKYAPDKIERVVVTSSFGAIIDFTKLDDKSFTFDETLWNPDTWESCQSNPVSGYCASKKFAEQAAWDFWKQNKDVVKFKLSTVNPVHVFGPQVFDSDIKETMNCSCEVINSILKGGPDIPVNPNSRNQFIDVRDIARAHLLAFQRENTIGKRLVLSCGDFNQQDIINVLNTDFPSLRGKVPAGNPENGILGTHTGAIVDCSKTKEILGFEFIDFKKTVDDTVEQVLRAHGEF